MIAKQQSKTKFDFDIKTLNSNNKKKYTKNSSNLKEIRDIFIRKQDLYLIKLLEKRLKSIKMYKSIKTNKNKLKLLNPSHFGNYLYENKISQNKENKQINSENNLKSIKIKLNKIQNETGLYINYEKDKNTEINQHDNLITSKIFNKDISKNNKKLLKIITKDNEYKYNYNYDNFFKTKNNNINSIIRLPKIKINKSNKNSRNYGNLFFNDDLFNNYKTIMLKTKNNNKNKFKFFSETFHDINKSRDDLAKKLTKDNYNIFYNVHSLSPISKKTSQKQNTIYILFFL